MLVYFIFYSHERKYITWCDIISIWYAFASHIIHHYPSQRILYLRFRGVIDRGCVHILHMHSWETILIPIGKTLKLTFHQAPPASQFAAAICLEGRYSRRELDGTNDLVPCVPICLIAYAWNSPFGDDLQDYRNDPARLEQVVTNRCTQRVPNDPPTRNDDLVAWIVIWWSARC